MSRNPSITAAASSSVVTLDAANAMRARSESSEDPQALSARESTAAFSSDAISLLFSDNFQSCLYVLFSLALSIQRKLIVCIVQFFRSRSHRIELNCPNAHETLSLESSTWLFQGRYNGPGNARRLLYSCTTQHQTSTWQACARDRIGRL